MTAQNLSSLIVIVNIIPLKKIIVSAKLVFNVDELDLLLGSLIPINTKFNDLFIKLIDRFIINDDNIIINFANFIEYLLVADQDEIFELFAYGVINKFSKLRVIPRNDIQKEIVNSIISTAIHYTNYVFIDNIIEKYDNHIYLALIIHHVSIKKNIEYVNKIIMVPTLNRLFPYSTTSKSDANNLNIQQNRAFRWACLKNHIPLAKILMNNNCSLNSNDNYPIRIACKNGYTKLVKLLLSNKSVSIHAKNDEPIKLACMNGHIDIVKLLILENANIGAKEYNTDCNDKTLVGEGFPLRIACKNNHVEIVKILLKDTSGKVNSTHSNNSAIMIACENGNYEILELLLCDNKISDEDIKNKCLPIVYKKYTSSADLKYVELFELLITNRNIDCNYYFEKSCYYGYLELFDVILKSRKINDKCYEYCVKTTCYYSNFPNQRYMFNRLIVILKINPNICNNYSIKTSCYYGYYSNVELLMKDSRIDLITDIDYCVEMAYKYNYIKLIRLMFNNQDINKYMKVHNKAKYDYIKQTYHV